MIIINVSEDVCRYTLYIKLIAASGVCISGVHQGVHQGYASGVCVRGMHQGYASGVCMRYA
jgi:hypothetical protein